MDSAVAVLDIAGRIADPVASYLPAFVADFMESGPDAEFLGWLISQRRVSGEAAARLRHALATARFECAVCGHDTLGSELIPGHEYRCPACRSTALKLLDGRRTEPRAQVAPRAQGSAAARRPEPTRVRHPPARPATPPATRQTTPPGPAAPATPVAVDEDDRVVIPTGRWVVQERIGAGAAGEVWKAWNSVLQQYTAVKVLTHGDRLSVERFRREAQAYGRLDHPNIVRVRDIGRFQGHPAIMLEWVDGGSLKDALDTGHRFPVREVMQIGVDVASALSVAHAAGIVHRDVKPANLLRARDGRIKVTDFGIAHLEDSRLTAAGAVIGTPAYISPEQVTSGEVAEASDIYSLGATLFHLLTGHAPFRERTAAAVMNAHATRRIPSVAEGRPDIHPAFDRLLREMTARNPVDRPDAVTVAARLDAMLREEATPPVAQPRVAPGDAPSMLRPRCAGVEVCRLAEPLDAHGWQDLEAAIRSRVTAGVAALVLELSGSLANPPRETLARIADIAHRVEGSATIAIVSPQRHLQDLLREFGLGNLRWYSCVHDAASALGPHHTDRAC